jgi:hypothetical protein
MAAPVRLRRFSWASVPQLLEHEGGGRGHAEDQREIGDEVVGGGHRLAELGRRGRRTASGRIRIARQDQDDDDSHQYAARPENDPSAHGGQPGPDRR